MGLAEVSISALPTPARQRGLPMFSRHLYNLNYGVIENVDAYTNVTKDVPINVPKEEERRQRVFDLIKNNEGITAAQLSQIMNIARKTISRDLERLTSSGAIIRVGGKKFGHWEIVKNSEQWRN